VRETGLQPTAADEVALVERALDEELLFRAALARGLDRDRSVRTWLIEQMRILSDDAGADDEALYARAVALGLDRKDLVVRRIMVQKMRLLAARAGEEEVGDDVLRAFYDQHRDDYRQPARVSAWHVYLATPRAEDAAPLLVAARAGDLDAAAAARRGDPFPQPPRLVSQSRQQLAKLFGTEVADQVMAAPERTWVGPLRSPLGAHLFWIEARELAAAPPFAAVRGRVLEAWRQERRAQRLAELLRALRSRQALQVESPAWRARNRA
jgi:peptidyl-prolyl cis-trans isomerase C